MYLVVVTINSCYCVIVDTGRPQLSDNTLLECEEPGH